METVTLKNGTVEVKLIVMATLRSLKSLISTDPGTFYELVMVCRDRDHKLFGNAREKLEASKLLQAHESRPHESIRNVILSAVTGDGLDMVLGSPV